MERGDIVRKTTIHTTKKHFKKKQRKTMTRLQDDEQALNE